jgi:hypothetical protein
MAVPQKINLQESFILNVGQFPEPTRHADELLVSIHSGHACIRSRPKKCRDDGKPQNELEWRKSRVIYFNRIDSLTNI